jgi:hypothetical protein
VGGLYGDEIVAVVAVQDALVQTVILRQPALDFVSVGVADPVDEDVGLDDKAVTGPVLAAQVFAHLDDGHTDFVAQYDRVGLHVAVDAGMVLPQFDHLGVREAQADGGVAYQQLIRADGGH